MKANWNERFNIEDIQYRTSQMTSLNRKSAD